MAQLTFPHLFVEGAVSPQDYISPSSGRNNLRIISRKDRQGHASFVHSKLEKTWRESKERKELRKAVSVITKHGTYVEFQGAPGYDLAFESLESLPSGIRLLNVVHKQNDQGQEVTCATIFVPEGKEAILLRKIEKYRDEDNFWGKPKNQKLVESIEFLREAVLESFWCDDLRLLPNEKAHWCEVWLRADSERKDNVSDFTDICTKYGIELKPDHLNFPERIVVLAKATDEQLKLLLSSSGNIAEFRRAKETAEFFLELENKDQTEWVQSLADRLNVTATTVAACVLDTGVNNGHLLLEPLLNDDDCHSVDVAWGTDDQNGHGTLMSGVVAYGNEMENHLQDSSIIDIPFRLESVKLIPSTGKHNDKELYGLRTKQALSRAEIENPDIERAVCLAITATDGRDRGRPSSWSGSIDQAASGAEDKRRRLFVVSAGNILEPSELKLYPDSNLTNAIHDPAQSWNALTVGSITHKTQIESEDLQQTYRPQARDGELSPYSTTSYTWETKWPNKPDVVFEGGNTGIDSNGFVTELDDLSILSTNYKPQEAQLWPINATSASAAQATNMAAKLMAQYPDMWPETIRGLIVHSAKWSDGIKSQFGSSDRTDKQNIERLLRVCGYGTPDFSRAISSAQNSLTLISQETIQPFCPKETGNEYQTKDMHLFKFPWPNEVLAGLPGETPVKIDITLSYFIEPGPGEIGWRSKYLYRSHGLDFNIKTPTEDTSEFVKRLNKAARGDSDTDSGGSSIPWTIGTKYGRTRGSVHRDWWNTNAAEASQCNVIGIFPKSGWWKERYHLRKGEKSTRYSLVVTLSTPSTEVDLYTPVATKIATIVPIQS